MSFSLLRPSPWQRRFSLAFGVYSAVITIAYIAYLVFNRSTAAESILNTTTILFAVVIMSALALVLSYRRPENSISWLLVLVTFMMQTNFLNNVISIALSMGIASTSKLVILENLWHWITPLTGAILAFIFILFPTGQLPSRRWQPTLWLLFLQIVLVSGLILFLSYDITRAFTSAEAAGVEVALTSLDNSGVGSQIIHVRAIPEMTFLIFTEALVDLLLVLLGLWSQIIRYQRGDIIVKQQIKWVIYAMMIWALSIILIIVPTPAGVLTIVLGFVSLLLPASIVLAILRYRLWDIDILINRTLVYGLLTSTLAIIYFGSVVLLQQIIQPATGQRSPITIVVSTLLTAALFSPLRRRIQDFIDRRFYRRRYDAEQTLAEFALLARDQVDLDQLTAELQRAVQETVQPERVSLWLKPEAAPNRHA